MLTNNLIDAGWRIRKQVCNVLQPQRVDDILRYAKILCQCIAIQQGTYRLSQLIQSCFHIYFETI